MLKRLACAVLATLTLAATGLAGPVMASEGDDGPPAPPGLVDRPWTEVRARLIQLGYQPVALVQPADETTCERKPDACRAWPELMECSGSGYGYCSFLYRLPGRNGRLFQVVTWGDNPIAFAGFGWLPPGVLRNVKFR